MLSITSKLKSLYNPYVLGVVSLGYVLGELGHYLIGVTSKAMAVDLQYGDVACQLNTTDYYLSELPELCSSANSSDSCYALQINGTSYCEWNRNGLGLDYQVLAGPSFIAVFTIVGVILGVAADRYNRVRMLAICTFVFSIAMILTGSVREYWQLVILRMILAVGEAGCNPMATGILSDIFPEEKRGLVMAIFNWGVYGGYGIAFPVGRYITKLNILELGWRACYYGAGIIALFIAFLTAFTLKEPERQAIGEETQTSKDAKKITIWDIILQPRIIMLCIAASIRHCGGMCFAYNCDLYFQTYFPDYDLGWALFAVTIVIGSIGVVVGGVVSDKFVAKMGVRSRVLILALSQLIATPGAFGSVYFDPLWAMITLGISYFFAEMWFGIVFAIMVEIVPLSVRSTTVGVFLFVMNNVGGNLPILVDPLSKIIGYREAIYVFYAGFYGISSILFFLTMPFMQGRQKKTEPRDMGHENGICTTADEHGLPTITNGKYPVLDTRTLEISRL